MIKQLATLAICFLTFGSFAKIRIVDNNVINAGNYSSLQKAIDESADGDTVFIRNSSINYESITIGKKLTLIGEGIVQNIQNHYIGSITLNEFTSGTKLIGIHCGSISSIANQTISDLFIDKSRLLNIYGNQTLAANRIPQFVNLVIQRSIIDQNLGYGDKIINSFITNSFIGNINIGSVQNDNLHIDHCSIGQYLGYGYLTISNSIIKDLTSSSIYPLVLNLYNNLINGIPDLSKSNASKNKEFDCESELELWSRSNYKANGSYYSKVFNSTSIAMSWADDGGQVGPYGGQFPFVEGKLSNTPIVKDIIIRNPRITSSSSLLNVELRANTVK